MGAFHLFGKTGENFLPNGTAQIFPQKKWNGTSVFHLTGVTLLCERRHVFGQKSAYSSREHGTSGWQQMEHRFSDHFGKNEKRGIPLKVFLFSEKFPVERPVPFDFPPERPVFPNKWKAPLVERYSVKRNVRTECNTTYCD